MKRKIIQSLLLLTPFVFFENANSQVISIPAFHESDKSLAKGEGEVFIQSRKDALSAGTFSVSLSVHFDPAVDIYPAGSISIKVNMSDGAKGLFRATTIDLINSYGKHNPTIYITGRCDNDAQPNAKGCYYWIEIANNKRPNEEGTPDIVGFAIHDRNGQRIAYGLGPLRSGDIEVQPK
jgi:hypothetical protein